MNPITSVSALAFVGLVSKWHLSRSPSKPALAEAEEPISNPPVDDEASKKRRSKRVGAREKKKDGEKEGEKEKEKAAEKDGVPVTDPNWQWSIYNETLEKGGKVTVTKRDAGTGDEGENGPFRVLFRIRKHLQWPDAVKVHLFSKPLCKIIEHYLPDNGDLKTIAEPEIDGRELCIVFDALKNHKFSSQGELEADGDEDGDGVGDVKPNIPNGNGVLDHHGTSNGNGVLQVANGNSLKPQELLSNGHTDCKPESKGMEGGELHLKHLLRFMEKEYRDVQARVQRMLEQKKVAWDLLWAFVPPGTKVTYSCDHSEELLYATVSSNYFQPPFGMSDWTFVVELEIWEFDGRSYRKCVIIRRIKMFDGERSFAGMAVCPVELLGIPEVLEERFLDSGKRYYNLTVKEKNMFMHYTGPLFQQKREAGCWQLHKENADGRVMVDLMSFAKMNPHYPMGNAQPPSASRCWTPRGDGSYSLCMVSSESYNAASGASEVSEENLIFAPGIVYGFSFSLKMWGCFAISGFRDIAFDSLAFHELVMEPSMKDLVQNLVGHYIAPPAAGSKPVLRVDPISNKGNGCVFLCYGPPGTGKTLTAESIAETMGRPLWSLSVSELGTTPKDLEQTLFKVLDIAAAWRAVLLLDEADVYLERRVSGADLTRNAMTGIFLRMLEYYRGVLFLTTNRIGTFDEAFRSRISMFLHYEALSPEHKAQIWKALLAKARLTDVGPEKLSELAALDLNGREIRNAIHTAQSWAQSKGETLELGHVLYVMNVVATSLESLNAAIKARAYD